MLAETKSCLTILRKSLKKACVGKHIELEMLISTLPATLLQTYSKIIFTPYVRVKTPRHEEWLT